jgi:hypothetical protein
MDGAVKGCKPVLRPAQVDQRCPQGTKYIGFAVRCAGSASQTQGLAQLTHSCTDITDVTQNDSCSLVSY